MASHLQSNTPRHVAFIMDGNGRWAKQHRLPRLAGHREGVKRLQDILEVAEERGIEVVSLFAFSSENWNRPKDEVDHLMKMFATFLQKESKRLQEHNVQLRVIGDLSHFNKKLQGLIQTTMKASANNSGLKLIVAANYGGQWDIVNAARHIAQEVKSGKLRADQIDEDCFASHLSFADLPNPDLMIRTSGEIRISNFFLWQLAYSELYFTDCYWPDFKKEQFYEALDEYVKRTRRFGKTDEQLGDMNA